MSSYTFSSFFAQVSHDGQRISTTKNHGIHERYTVLKKLASVHRYTEFMYLAYWRYLVPMKVKTRGVILHSGVKFFGMPIIKIANNSFIEIGSKATLCSDSAYTDLGVNHPVILRTLRPGAKIVIGENSGLSGTAICAAIEVTVGRDCLIGANVTIVDTDFHSITPTNRRSNGNFAEIPASPVTISDNVFLGAGSLVLKGVSIGRNSVVGAGSVVSRDVPDNVVVAGNPAKIVRAL